MGIWYKLQKWWTCNCRDLQALLKEYKDGTLGGGTGTPHIIPTAIDLKATGNPNEFTVDFTYTDENGAPQVVSDTSPITITHPTPLEPFPTAAPTTAVDFSMFPGATDLSTGVPEYALLVEPGPSNRVHVFRKGSGWQTLISADPA